MKLILSVKVLLIFALGSAVAYSTDVNAPCGKQNDNKIENIRTEFWKHIKNIQNIKIEDINIKKENIKNNNIKMEKNTTDWILDPKYRDSFQNICTEISSCILGTDDMYASSMKYSDGRSIPEFIENDGFKTVSEYENKNWNYLFLMNLLQDIKNSNITNIVDDEQKNYILDKVVMDIRNAKIREASEYEYDQWKYKGCLDKARNDIKKYFDCLDLWKFVLHMRDNYKYCTPCNLRRTD